MNDTILEKAAGQNRPALTARSAVKDVPPNVPEKFLDPQTGVVRVEALLRSYQELERKLSSRPSCPDHPEDYKVDVSHGLFEADIEMNRRFHERGFTAEQVQFVYDLAAEKFVPMILEMAQDYQADREVERLITAFGGQDKFQEISRQILAYGKKNLSPDILETLAGSFEGVMALYRMMQSGEPSVSFKEGGENLSGQQTENDLKKMMRDPRYWRYKRPVFCNAGHRRV